MGRRIWRDLNSKRKSLTLCKCTRTQLRTRHQQISVSLIIDADSRHPRSDVTEFFVSQPVRVTVVVVTVTTIIISLIELASPVLRTSFVKTHLQLCCDSLHIFVIRELTLLFPSPPKPPNGSGQALRGYEVSDTRHLKVTQVVGTERGMLSSPTFNRH